MRDTIRETISGTDIPPGVRLKAALSVLHSVAAMDGVAEKWRIDEYPFSAIYGWGNVK